MYQDPSYNTFWQIYLVFAIGCIVIFFFGVCALLCCCRQRFRGMERKGYIIRDAAPTQPLIQPTAPRTDPGFAVVTGQTYPVQQPPYPPTSQYPPSQCPPSQYPPAFPTTFGDNPPAYDLPPKY